MGNTSFKTVYNGGHYNDILQNVGKVTVQIIKEFAISEFEKYKIIQDKSYKSDFDRLLGEIDILLDLTRY